MTTISGDILLINKSNEIPKLYRISGVFSSILRSSVSLSFSEIPVGAYNEYYPGVSYDNTNTSVSVPIIYSFSPFEQAVNKLILLSGTSTSVIKSSVAVGYDGASTSFGVTGRVSSRPTDITYDGQNIIYNILTTTYEDHVLPDDLATQEDESLEFHLTYSAFKWVLTSGQFTTTIKHSLLDNSRMNYNTNNEPPLVETVSGISFDGSNTLYVHDKLYLMLGKFSTTIFNSQIVTHGIRNVQKVSGISCYAHDTIAFTSVTIDLESYLKGLVIENKFSSLIKNSYIITIPISSGNGFSKASNIEVTETLKRLIYEAKSALLSSSIICGGN